MVFESLLLCGLLPLLGRSCSVPLGEIGFGPGQRSAYSVDYEKGSGFECSGKDVLCHANPGVWVPTHVSPTKLYDKLW